LTILVVNEYRDHDLEFDVISVRVTIHSISSQMRQFTCTLAVFSE